MENANNNTMEITNNTTKAFFEDEIEFASQKSINGKTFIKIDWSEGFAKTKFYKNKKGFINAIKRMAKNPKYKLLEVV